jgi:hypothetical protein
MAIAEILAEQEIFGFRDFNGNASTLAPYAAHCKETSLGARGRYQLSIKPIFPYKQPIPAKSSRTATDLGTPQAGRDSEYLSIPRYAFVIRTDNGIVWQRRYSTDQTPPAEAIERGRKRIDWMRLEDRFRYLLAPVVLFSTALVAAASWFFGPILGWWIIYTNALIPCLAFAIAPARSCPKDVVMRLGGQTWDLNNFCRGWIVTGGVGSGKTQGLTIMLHSIFRHVMDWGGLACDEKGVWYEVLTGIAKKHGRERDLLLLQTRPRGAPADWKPPAKFNLLSDPDTPSELYATLIVETAAALSGGINEKGFFKTQAHAHIRYGITLFRLVGYPPSLHHLLELLTQIDVLKDMLRLLAKQIKSGNEAALECYYHFLENYIRQPPEQLGGVTSTIYNYLNYFNNSEIAEVFGDTENTFDFSYLDDGAIICISMPQKYKTERQYVTTILKQLAYAHGLRRFEPRPDYQRSPEEDNLLIIWQDEAQRFVTEDDGNVDMIRQARMTTVMATQTSISFIPRIGKEKTEVILANLSNRLIYKAADQTCAQLSADFIGKRPIWKRSYSSGKGAGTTSKHRDEEYYYKPYELRSLRKFQCVLVHPEEGFCKIMMHPVGVDGKRPKWYPLWRKLLLS